MPVVVTGADGPLGAAVVAALVADPGVVAVRATVRERAGAAPLAALGVPVAVLDVATADAGRLGAVLEGAHTVVHLEGPEPLLTWAQLVDAAEDTGVRRVVTVASVGTAVPACPPYDLVVVRTAVRDPRPSLVAALVDADRRRHVAGR